MNEKSIIIKITQDPADADAVNINCDVDNIETMQDLLLATAVLIQTSLDMADEPISMEDYLDAIRETIDENPIDADVE